MQFKIKKDKDFLILLTDNVEIIIPESELDTATKIYQEIFPFLDLDFSYIYDTFIQDENLKMELTIKDEFAELFLNELRKIDNIKFTEVKDKDV